MHIYPFLNFNGNCSEAMHFYQSCFGGELRLHYLKDAPDANDLPPEMTHFIVSASLVSRQIRLFASDLMDGEGIFNSSRVSLFFVNPSLHYLRSLFDKLSLNGTISYPVSDKMLSGEWASLTDQYGVQWIFAVDAE